MKMHNNKDRKRRKWNWKKVLENKWRLKYVNKFIDSSIIGIFWYHISYWVLRLMPIPCNCLSPLHTKKQFYTWLKHWFLLFLLKQYQTQLSIIFELCTFQNGHLFLLLLLKKKQNKTITTLQFFRPDSFFILHFFFKVSFCSLKYRDLTK